MESARKILLSGIQPSGRPHIGNYFGAMKQFVEMQKDHECYFPIVDYHALNTVQDPNVMRENILNLAIDYLAIGLDPKQSVIFQQSSVSEHTELAWIFDTITTMPFLERAHAYKDAQAKNKEISVGLLNYPMLMAADILLYDPDIIPVGADQKQHVEITRDTAEKFNRIYGDTFKLPEAKILPNVAIVPGIDGRKMSKSYGNTIPLFAEDGEIEKLVMSIVTDSSEGMPKNVYEIHKLFRPESELAPLYQSKAGKYKELKEALIDDIRKFIKPLRERRTAIEDDANAVLKVLKEGGERACAVAIRKMERVRHAVGVSLQNQGTTKDFDGWNRKKRETHYSKSSVLFYEREVWWCSHGVNIGVEIDGRHELFLRPVLILRKFNKDMALVVPTTAKDKKGRYYLSVAGEDGKKYTVCLSQVRTISTKRLLRKIGTITQGDYRTVGEKVSHMVKTGL